MKAYLLMFKTQSLMTLQYRAQAMAGVFTQFAFGFMRVFVMIAFYAGSSSVQPMSLTQVVTYIWMTQILLTLMAWRPDPETVTMVREGTIAYEIVRPVNLSFAWLMRSLARRGFMPLMRGIPILVIALVLPSPYRMVLPLTFSMIVLSILVLILAWLLGGMLNNLLNILTVYLMSADGLAKLFPIVMMFFSGLILPIPLFPIQFQKALSYTPFSGLMDTPARVIMGHYNTTEAISAMFVQLVWIVVIFVFNDFLLENKLKKIVVQGG
jgi:ABC-2 type transport system permease protein